jgi:hypothetical protein
VIVIKIRPYIKKTNETEFKFDCLSSTIFAQVGISGNPLHSAMKFSWSPFSFLFFGSSHLRMYATPRLSKIKFVISDAGKYQTF